MEENKTRDYFLTTPEGRKEVWRHFIKYVRGGGLFYNFYTDARFHFIHWKDIERCIKEHPDEMNIDQFQCAMSEFKTELIRVCREVGRGDRERISPALLALLIKIYMPPKDKDEDNTTSEHIGKLEETRLRLQQKAGQKVTDINKHAESTKAISFIKELTARYCSIC